MEVVSIFAEHLGYESVKPGLGAGSGPDHPDIMEFGVPRPVSVRISSNKSSGFESCPGSCPYAPAMCASARRQSQCTVRECMKQLLVHGHETEAELCSQRDEFAVVRRTITVTNKREHAWRIDLELQTGKQFLSFALQALRLLKCQIPSPQVPRQNIPELATP